MVLSLAQITKIAETTAVLEQLSIMLKLIKKNILGRNEAET